MKLITLENLPVSKTILIDSKVCTLKTTSRLINLEFNPNMSEYQNNVLLSEIVNETGLKIEIDNCEYVILSGDIELKLVDGLYTLTNFCKEPTICLTTLE